jgi:ABC-2 type transport system ATP-binding protein
VPDPSPSLAIDLHHVEKVYRGKVQALRGVAMQVRPGEIFGLLGPNGAGKSTLVKIMMTVVRPTRAEGTILGRAIGDQKNLVRVGYLPEHHRLPDYLTGAQALDFYGAMSKVDRHARRSRAADLFKLVGMTDWADKKVSSYSKGMQQRVGLAQALINDPELVVLDEPTDGVDPVGRREIRDILVDLRRQGRTVFLNSHLLSELEMVCDRVAILVQGRVAMQGTLDELTADSRRHEIEIDGDAPPWTSEIQGLRADQAQGGRCRLVLAGTDPGPVQPVLDRLRADGRVIREVRPVRESLEDLFMRAVTDPVTGQVLQPGAARDKADDS